MSGFQFELTLALKSSLTALLILVPTGAWADENFQVCTANDAAWSCLAQAETKVETKGKSRQSSSSTRTTTTTTTTESTSSDERSDADVASTSPGAGSTIDVETREGVITTKFGSKAASGLTGCKTEDVANSKIKDLKGDCNAWLKDRKSELKIKYLTGTCEEDCSDCGMSLKRCTVTGSVHYLK